MALPSPAEVDAMMAAENATPAGTTDLGTIGLSPEPKPSVSSLPSPSAIQEMMDTESASQPQQASWGDATSFVAKSLAEGASNIYDIASYALPQFFPQMGGADVSHSTMSNLMKQVLGSPYDLGDGREIKKTPATEVIKAGVEGSVFPGEGTIVNTLASMGSEIVHQMYPDSKVAPIAGALLTAGGASALRGVANTAISAGKAFERSSVGAGVRDYLKSQKITGLMTDAETGDLGTRVSQAIDEVGKKEGFGFLRDPQRLAERNAKALKDLGGKIATGLADADTAGAVPKVDLNSATSATQKIINAAKAERADVKQAVSEFMDRFLDPVDGWDGTVSGLNSWKGSIQQMAFSGSASGKLTPAVTRRVQRAIADDLSKAVNEAVVKSGASTADDWSTLMRDYSNHATLAPIINPGVARGLAGTWDKAAKGLLRTSGGTLTTPTIIGGALVGSGGGAIAGLTAGGVLALLGSPTGQGITGAALKAAGRAGKSATKGLLTAPIAAMATRDQEKNPLGSLLDKTTAKASKTAPISKMLSSVVGIPEASATENITRGGDVDLTKEEIPAFGAKVDKIAKNLGADPQHLLAVMKFETGGSLSSSEKNKAGSGATGLIQFMPSTAKELTGADTKAAAIRLMESMTPTEQLDYVEKYLKPFKGKLKTLDDVYMAVLYPKAIGKDSEYALFKKGTTAYWQNKGLDIDKDGIVTKAEAASKVRKYGVTTA